MKTKTETYLYCRPHVLASPASEAQIDQILRLLARELGFGGDPGFRERDGNSIVVRGFGPDEVWSAMDRISTYWSQRELFVLPQR